MRVGGRDPGGGGGDGGRVHACWIRGDGFFAYCFVVVDARQVRDVWGKEGLPHADSHNGGILIGQDAS